MAEPADVSVIIVNWNACALLAGCLHALLIQEGVTKQMIVVDNASTDGSVEMMHARFPEVTLLANARNRGFAVANNQGARLAAGRYLLLLNPDTEFPPAGLATLVHFADAHPDAAVIGPRLLNADGTQQRSAWRGFPSQGTALADALYLWKLPWLPISRASELTPNELRLPQPVDHLLGACLLIRRAAWESIGPLDERFFLFLEETDWCRRARAAGWQVLYTPEPGITHFGQQSMRQVPIHSLPHLYRSTCIFYRKQHARPGGGLALLKIIMALAVVVRLGLWTVRYGRATQANARRQAARTLAGYARVLRELPQY